VTATDPVVVPRHPAKFSQPVLDAGLRVLTEHSPNGPLRILDPYAGVGGIHQLHAKGGHDTVGVDLQPEWAQANPRTIVGDATALPAGWTDGFDGFFTSVNYGNRMADHHNAMDPCKKCAGEGVVERMATPAEVDAGCELGIAYDPCKHCRGSGKSPRNTYAHCLRESGAELVAGSASAMHWGPAYRAHHVAFVKEMGRVVRPGGLGLLNISNHMKGDVEVNVAEWFLHVFISQGWYVWEVRRIGTRRNGQGANRDTRVDGELLLVLHNGTPRLSWA
jgi:SAM-dependent methyltransferase